MREGEVMHLDRGRTVLSAGAVRDGRLVALTDLRAADPAWRGSQGRTLVLREHRLGALVKAAVLRQRSAMPEVRRVTTHDAEHDARMVAVDEAHGSVRAGVLSSWSRRRCDPGGWTRRLS